MLVWHGLLCAREEDTRPLSGRFLGIMNGFHNPVLRAAAELNSSLRMLSWILWYFQVCKVGESPTFQISPSFPGNPYTTELGDPPEKDEQRGGITVHPPSLMQAETPQDPTCCFHQKQTIPRSHRKANARDKESPGTHKHKQQHNSCK